MLDPELGAKVNWQPISMLPVVAQLIEETRTQAEDAYGILQSCRATPHRLDSHTVGRYIDVYTEEKVHVEVYAKQLARWRGLQLTPFQREQVNGLSEHLPAIRERITAILGLAEEISHGTIDVVMAKSDLELGVDWLLRQLAKT